MVVDLLRSRYFRLEGDDCDIFIPQGSSGVVVSLVDEHEVEVCWEHIFVTNRRTKEAYVEKMKHITVKPAFLRFVKIYEGA